MIEYLYDCVVASAGEDISITAVIMDCDKSITKGCYLVLLDNDKEIVRVEGTYIPEITEWTFTIPADKTQGEKGRYWYQVFSPDMSVSFKQPIYLK